MSRYKISKKYKGVESEILANGDIAYHVRYINNLGKRVRVRVGTKNNGYNEKLASLKRGDLQNAKINNQDLYFDEIANRFLDIKLINLSKSSKKGYKGMMARLIKYFGHQKLSQIRTKDINTLIINISKELAPKYINNHILILKSVFALAKSEYDVDYLNIFESIKQLKEDNKRERFLSVAEIEVLKNNIEGEHLLFVLLSLSTGARLASILEIKKSDIDLDKREVKIKDIKNNSLYKAYLNNEATLLLADKLPTLSEGDKVISYCKNTITRRLKEVLDKLYNTNLAKDDRKQRVVIHSLRHTFASHLAIRGAPLQIIQKLLNHKDIKMTMRYAHLMPDSGKEWVVNANKV